MNLLADADLVQRVRSELPGKRLACWCSPKLCHCHVLACIANSPNKTCTQQDLATYIRYLAEHRRQPQARAGRASAQREKPKEAFGARGRGVSRAAAASDRTGTSRGPAKSSAARALAAAEVIDIGINITSKKLRSNWREMVARAEAAGVPQILLTGTSVRCSRESLQIAHTWERETQRRTLFCTVGVHPHDAKSFNARTVADMRSALNDELAVAVGECGLDYNRNFSTPEQQRVS